MTIVSAGVDLKISDAVLEFCGDCGIPLEDICVPRWKTPEAGEVLRNEVEAGTVRFNGEHVYRIIYDIFPRLMHTQGKWAGLPFRPDPWQVAYVIAPTYGWQRYNEELDRWLRIVRTQYVDVPRKAGKSTMSGAQAILLTAADDEPGAQVYAAACAKDQARFVFDPVKAIAERSPSLRDVMKTTSNRIRYTARKSFGSYFAVVSSAADLLHGANVHGAIIDELHKHAKRDLVDALQTGTGARDQPLIILITTADDSRPDTIYAETREYCERLAHHTIVDPTFYGVVFAAPDNADPFAESTWKLANPGYGISPTKAFLESEAKKAQNSPANLARFKRLHLGIRTKQETKYIELKEWDRNSSIVVEEDLVGRTCYGGLDLANVSDFCALALDFPRDGEHDVLWRLWLPEAQLTKLDERTAGNGSVWVRNGYLTLTPGEVTDYDFIHEQIKRDADRFEIAEIGYDPWNSSQLVIDLGNEGLNMVPVRQGFGSLSSPTKELHRLLLEGTPEHPVYRHGGNPVMRWMIDNLAVAMDPAGNVKPDKSKAGDKIDGVSAAVIALDRSMLYVPPRRSIYETESITFA